MSRTGIPVHRIGTSAEYSITLESDDGSPLGYSGSEALTATLWAGDDRTGIPVAAEWDAPPDVIVIAIASTDLAGLDPGRYRLAVEIAGAEAASLLIDLQRGSGSATAQPIYATYDDLRGIAPWVDDLHSDADQAGFREQLAKARRWVDDIIVQRYNERGWRYGAGTAFPQVIRDWLAENRLILTTENGSVIIDACANYAASLIAGRQIPGANDGAWEKRAIGHYQAATNSVALCHAEIDTSTPPDGRGELLLSLGATGIS